MVRMAGKDGTGMERRMCVCGDETEPKLPPLLSIDTLLVPAPLLLPSFLQILLLAHSRVPSIRLQVTRSLCHI